MDSADINLACRSLIDIIGSLHGLSSSGSIAIRPVPVW